MAGRIFVSYGRAETAPQAAWLCDRLAERFGRHQVVKDADPAAAGSCDVLLALIGRYWLTPAGPDDVVRREIESALAHGVPVIPVLVDGARMPAPGELPPSLAGLAQRPPSGLGAASPELDVSRLVQVLDQSIAERQATQLGAAPDFSGPGLPGAGPGPSARETPVPRPLPYATKPLPPKRRFGTRTLILAGGTVVVVAAAVAFAVIPRGHSGAAATGGSSSSPAASPSAVSSHRGSASPKATGSGNVLLTDDFSSAATGWTDDAHQGAGTYTGGAYRLSVTGANGVSELARPMNAAHGLGEATPLNLSATVDVRKLSGAPQGYGLGLGLRSDGGGDVYAFLVMDHAVAIQKWVGGGARVTGVPAPVSTSALHTGAADRLRAVCQTAADGTSVHLELWLNGTKMVDYTDRDHPYTKGYMGLYVETISDASSTAAAEFDNFTAAQIRG